MQDESPVYDFIEQTTQWQQSFNLAHCATYSLVIFQENIVISQPYSTFLAFFSSVYQYLNASHS